MSVSSPFEFQPPEPKTRRRTWRGMALRGLGAIVLCLLVAILAWQVSAGLTRPSPLFPVEDKLSMAANAGHRQRDAIAIPLPSGPTIPVDEAAGTVVSPDDANSPAARWRQWEQGVVTIESRLPGQRLVHGTGVLLGDSGRVATCFHVTRPCLEGCVRMADGTEYEIAGYAAVAPEFDLALLALHDAPGSLPGFAAAPGDPAPRSPVWAMGHPQGMEFSVTSGTVSRVLGGQELSGDAQRFARQLAGPEVRWIQHTARVSEGNSGGPLLDGRGRLLGLNAWVAGESGFTYAIHVRHVVELLSRQSKSILPLAELADPRIRSQHELGELSPVRLKEMFETARRGKWRPVTREDYRNLQQLAYGVTAAFLPDALAARGQLADQLEALAGTADRVVEDLRRQVWDDPGQITLTNEFAEGELLRPDIGLFLFASIERLVEGDDGRRGLIANLAGFERPLFIELAHDQLSIPAAGDQCLILGVHPRDRVMRYGDNPLRPIVAPLIVTRVILKL